VISFENHRNGLIADRVCAELKAGGIGFHHAVAHQRNRMHFVGKNAVVVWLVLKRLEEIRSRRTERAIGESLQCADAKKRPTEGVPDSDFCLVVNLRDKRRGINASRQLAALQQFRISGDIFVVRIHMLHTGDAKRSSVSESAFYSFHSLIMRERRDDFIDQIHGRIF
jgi:hypothetical protein